MFTKRLNLLMSERGMCRADLFKQTHIPETTISGWYNSQKKPNLDSLMLLADYFNCSIDYLVGRENEVGVIELNLSPIENSLLTAFRKLPVKEQNRFVGVVEAFAM